MSAFASDCRPPVEITPRELASFQDILDKDKNGIVERVEFTSFFFDLAWITAEDRAAFVKVCFSFFPFLCSSFLMLLFVVLLLLNVWLMLPLMLIIIVIFAM
jgi:hypothetical protein